MIKKLLAGASLPLFALSATISSLAPTNIMAQTPVPNEPPPAISVSASYTVKVNPDRAKIYIAVQTKHETAARAAEENAQKQNAVLAALKALGLTDDQISTMSYQVSPNYRYEPNREPILTGYIVSNTVLVDLKDIKQVGAVIDASLKNGANDISSLSFYASNTDAAREQALGQAVMKAKREADIVASAIGGKVVDMIEITINQDQPLPPRAYAKLEAAADALAGSTPISAGEQSVIVTVYTRWKYSANK